MEGVFAPIESLDDLRDAHRLLERATAEVALADARFEASGVWGCDGSVSMVAWLRYHCRMSHTVAARWLRDGRFLARFDAVADAALAGRLSHSQVAVIRANVPRATEDVFAGHQHGVVASLADVDLAGTDQVCQRWREHAEAVIDTPEPVIRDREWRSSQLDDGTTVGSFVLDRRGAEEMDTALHTARVFDGAGDTRTVGQRNADAIVDIFAFFNANHAGNGTPRHRPHVELNYQANDLAGFAPPHAVTADGMLLPGWAREAYLCDCVIHRVLRSAAGVTEYGRATRSVPLELFRAVAARDGGCRAPGCTRKIAWCDAHHIIWWRHGGATNSDNLILLCSHHHHLIHRQHWTVALQPNGNAHFTLPDNTLLSSQPRGQPTIRAA